MIAELRNVEDYKNMSRHQLNSNILNTTLYASKPTSKLKPKPESVFKAKEKSASKVEARRKSKPEPKSTTPNLIFNLDDADKL